MPRDLSPDEIDAVVEPWIHSLSLYIYGRSTSSVTSTEIDVLLRDMVSHGKTDEFVKCLDRCKLKENLDVCKILDIAYDIQRFFQDESKCTNKKSRRRKLLNK